MQRNWFRDKYYQNSLRLLCARTVLHSKKEKRKKTQNYTTHSIIMKLRKLSLMTLRVFMAWCAMRSVHLCCHFHTHTTISTCIYVVIRWWRSLQINRNIEIIAWNQADKRTATFLLMLKAIPTVCVSCQRSGRLLIWLFFLLLLVALAGRKIHYIYFHCLRLHFRCEPHWIFKSVDDASTFN